MSNIQYILSIDGLVTAILSLIFGFSVISKNRKNIINQTLFLLSFTTAIWSLGYWRWLSVYEIEENALFWARILSVGSIFIPVFYFHWIVSLLNLNHQKKFLIYLSYFLGFVFLSLSFSQYFVKGVESYNNYFAFWPKAGLLYSLYLFFIYGGLVIYSIYLLYTHYINSAGQRKSQLRYVLLGSVLGLGGGATNFFLWYDINILPLGNFFVVLYPMFFSYSIIVHRLMDIKFVLRKSSVYLASFAVIAILATVVKYFLDTYFAKISLGADFAVLIIGILAFQPVRNYFYYLANKYFFSSLYDSRQVISEVSDNLRSTLEVRKIYDFIYKALASALHVKAFGALSYDEKNNIYLVEYNKGFNVGNRKKFPSNSILHKEFISNNESIIVEEIKNTHKGRQTKEIINLMTGLKVDVLTPLNIKDKTIGLIVLGPKESGDMYNDEDLQVLKTVSAFAAIAIDHALQYEETLNFNLKLKNEVAKATKELREANEELKKLDAAKSEFISIASHQLRTPLTVIKGYISMMLEGSFGELTPAEKESLEKVYESNERLIQLVENLLNISRIESGRLQFDYEYIRLEDIVSSVIEELAGTAKKKGLTLNYNEPVKPLPKLKIDEEKIRQVVLNLIDNSIKYTKKGSVTVSLNKIGGNIRFGVSDSGMGIRKEDLPNLFKKFSRGKGTSIVHTEGTGLGLYVAEQMINSHKGKIWAESEGENRGAKFCFELPIV